MGFIFGIVNFDNLSVEKHDIGCLSEAMKNNGFEDRIISGSFFSVGCCWNPTYSSTIEVFKFKQLTIIADIRLYNIQQLKNEYHFNTAAEAFLKVYLEKGFACGNYLNGDFAVVIIDEEQRKVHLFRDHIGGRSLVYHFNAQQLIFASHEFGLAKSGLFQLKLSEQTAIKRFFHLLGDYPLTVFDQIKKLTPGHSITFSKSKTKSFKYWRPDRIKTNQSLSFEDTVSILRSKIIEATTSRVSDGKIGVHISGGLDSTGIGCILDDYLNDKQRVIGYSWSPAEFKGHLIKGEDEKKYITNFIEERGINVKFVRDNDSTELLENFTLPDFETQFIEHPTMKMAEKDQVQTLFSGWGGDEFVSSGKRGIFAHLFFRLQWLSLARFILKNGFKSSIRLFRVEVLPTIVPFGLLNSYGPFAWSHLRYFKYDFIIRNLKNILLHKRQTVFSIFGYKHLMYNLIDFYHIPDRIDSWLIYGEKYGFEYRYPLLDKDLLEFWFSIPTKYMMKNFESRVLYREALQGILTESVRKRSEKGEISNISNLFQSRIQGFPKIRNYIENISTEREIPFFKRNIFYKVAESVTETDLNTTEKIKVRIKIRKTYDALTTYLRYINLYNEYFINSRKEEQI